MALVPKPSSYVVDPSSPFGADCFGLERFAEALTDLVRHTQSSFVVNLEAPWGQGKTTFLEMWRHHLHGQKVQSLYFNAWETDFSTDPLIALIGELGESMASLSAAGSSAAAKHLEKLRKVGARLAMRSVPALIKAGTMGLLDLEDAIEGAIADAGEKVAEEEIKRYVESKQSIHKFREELALFAKALTERGDPASPLVIVIDELDRCRPDYAIKILETVKHFFAVQGVFFVIATDSKQLSNAIRHVYGLDVASEDYLRRFFDLSISMPLPSTEQFVPAQFARFGLDEFFKARTHHELRYDREQAIAALVAMFNATNCSLRDQMKCMTLLTISLRSIEENNYVHPLLLCTLIVLRVKRQRLFEQFVEGDVGVREVVQELSSSPPGRAFFSSSRGFGAVIYAYLIHATKDRLRRDSVVDSLRAASKSDDPGANADFARHVIEVMEHHSFRTSVHAMRHVLPRIELFARKSDDL